MCVHVWPLCMRFHLVLWYFYLFFLSFSLSLFYDMFACIAQSLLYVRVLHIHLEISSQSSKVKLSHTKQYGLFSFSRFAVIKYHMCGTKYLFVVAVFICVSLHSRIRFIYNFLGSKLSERTGKRNSRKKEAKSETNTSVFVWCVQFTLFRTHWKIL